MSQFPQLEALCMAVVMADPADFGSLVAMHGRIAAVKSELRSAELTKACECADQASRLLESIVLRETTDAASVLDQVRSAMVYLQTAAQEHERGRSPDGAGTSPFEVKHNAAVADAAPIDQELLSAWLSGVAHTLSDLEALAIEIESSPDPEEQLAEIRRGIHSLKGECGVIPLHAAQKLLHDAETAIDTCIASKAPFPSDGILAVMDWLKGYSRQLERDPRLPAPSDAEVRIKFSVAPSPVAARATQTAPAAAAPAPVAAAASGPSAAPAPAPVQPAAEDNDPTPVSFTLDSSADDSIKEFLAEAREHMSQSERALLDLEHRPGDLELVNTVFRAFHTIKGVAGFMNLEPIVTLAHAAECVLDAIRSGTSAATPATLDLVLKSCDLMNHLVGALEGGAAPTRGQLATLVGALGRIVNGSHEPEPVAATSAVVAPAPTSTMSVVSVSATQPAGAAHPEGTTQFNPSTVAATADAGAAHPVSSSSVRRADHTVKVSTTRMDSLLDMVGELVIAQQMVWQDPAISRLNEQRVQRNLSAVGKIIRDLQAVSMSLRMVSLKSTFQKMSRLVRDVSAKAGKRVAFHTEGEDVELDRNVVEEIADPLVHMIRNSCDHGIEAGPDRLKVGKPECGNLHLRAYHSGGSIVVEVEDDGKGLDRARILRKAIEKGIYSPDRPLDEIPDHEVFELVFLPGFSTAEKVTDISGRGVGMDVVRRNIEALRGKVDIRSTAGKGTVFSMRLPLTMAIIDGMVVRVGTQRYVIPTLSIEQSFRPQKRDLHTVTGKGEMAMVRGALLPVYHLCEVLGMGPRSRETSEALLVAVETHDARACVAVDDILGQQQVVIKTLGSGARATRGVAGGAILGDGRVALILDVGGIVQEAAAT